MSSRFLPLTGLLAFLACESAPAPGRADAGPGVADAADAGPDAIDCMPSTHPGTLTMVNEVTGETKVVALTPDEEPRWWRNTPTGRVPVVKSVYLKTGSGQAEILLYGPCGQFLESILGAP
jgi:hypothetical protein